METPNNPGVTTPQGATPNPGGTPTPTNPGNPGNPPAPTTTETLFPDFIDKDGHLHDVQVRPELAPFVDPFASREKPVGEGAPVTEPPAPATPPPAADPNAPQFINLDDLKGKLVKVKVDGVEMDVPADQVVKSYQLESHLQARVRDVAEREKKLFEIQQEMLKGTVRPGIPAGEPIPPTGEEPPAPAGVQETPEFKALQKQLDLTRAEMAQLQKATQEVRYQNGLKKIADQVKTEFGRDDFLQRVPEIEKQIKAQLKDPANPTLEEIARYDNADYYTRAYEKMLLKEVLSGKPLGSPPPASPPPAAPPASPPPNFRRPAPVIVESGGGSPPSVRTQIDSWQVRYTQALQKASNSGKSEDWEAVIRIKSEPIPAS